MPDANTCITKTNPQVNARLQGVYKFPEESEINES